MRVLVFTPKGNRYPSGVTYWVFQATLRNQSLRISDVAVFEVLVHLSGIGDQSWLLRNWDLPLVSVHAAQKKAGIHDWTRTMYVEKGG
jgi:hypothetical protein